MQALSQKIATPFIADFGLLRTVARRTNTLCSATDLATPQITRPRISAHRPDPHPTHPHCLFWMYPAKTREVTSSGGDGGWGTSSMFTRAGISRNCAGTD